MTRYPVHSINEGGGGEERGDGGKFQAEEECSVDLWGSRPTYHELDRILALMRREKGRRRKRRKSKNKREREKEERE